MIAAKPDLNFGDLYEAVAEAFPERTAIIHGDLTYTWREMDEQANRLARRLAQAGLQPGSKVAFYLRNTPAYVLLWNACAKGRFVHANINYRYVEQELYYLLDNSDAEAVAYHAEHRDYVDRLKAKLPKVRMWLEVGDEDVPGFAVSFEAACLDGDGSPLDIKRSGDDLYFMYTGGTTGYPKAVMWPARERIAAIEMTSAKDLAGHVEQLRLDPSVPIALPAAPMMHSTGLTTMMNCLVNAGCIVIPPMRSFDPQLCLEEIAVHRVSRLAIVGDAFSLPLIEALRKGTQHLDLSSVTLISSAGAMWSDHAKRALLDYFPNATISDSLGSSEGSRLGSSITRHGQEGTTGRFEPGPFVKVFREDFTEIPFGTGEAGLLATAGALPLGYYKDPEKTAATFPTINGVRYSIAGDWVRVDEDGTMVLLGRGSNCINTGGEKVYPEEVEEALKQVPGVLDAAVVGVPDERFGQAVAALVRTQDGRQIPSDHLRLHLDTAISRYKHPRHVWVVHEEFRHDNGKVSYRTVKDMVANLLPG